MNELESVLRDFLVFSKLTKDDRIELANRAVRKTYKKGEFICWQGETWFKVLFLSAGGLEWSMLSPQGKRQVVFRIEPPCPIWGHSIFDNEPMPASLEVMEDSEVYIWSAEIIKPIISRRVEAVWDISAELVTMMRKVRNIVYGFAFHQVSGRLARLLLDFYHPSDGMSANRDLTLEEMANSIGTTKELVSKTLHQFADEGMIEINRMQFVFTDRESLEVLAGQDEELGV